MRKMVSIDGFFLHDRLIRLSFPKMYLVLFIFSTVITVIVLLVIKIFKRMAMTNRKRKSHINTFVSASKSSRYLTPAWQQRILKDYEKEAIDNPNANDKDGEIQFQQLNELCAFGEYLVADNNEWEVQLLYEDTRIYLWEICKMLDVGTETIAPTACRILERYLSKKTCRAVHPDPGGTALDKDEWRNFTKDTTTKFPLLAAVSVQLTAKMTSTTKNITALKVQLILMQKGLKYSLSEVKSAEFEVFEAIGFRIPLWSSLETAQLLSREAGLSLTLLPTVARSVELAEMRRPTLQHNVSPDPSDSATLATLHLCAGAVAAAAKLSDTDVDPAPALAEFTKAPVNLIRLLADLIVAMALGSSSDESDSDSDTSSD